MGYALQSMLKIRAMREDRTQTALAQARGARAHAEKVLEQKTQAVINYEVTKDERRDHVYEAVLGKVVSMDELDDVRLAISKIDEEGVLLVEDERRAKDEVEAKERAVEDARQKFVIATREKCKIEEHRRLWLEEERHIEELTADRELEDFVSRKAEI